MVFEVSGKKHFHRDVSERDRMQKGLLVILISAFMIQLYLPSLTIHAQSQDVIEVGKFSVATVGDTLPPWLEAAHL